MKLLSDPPEIKSAELTIPYFELQKPLDLNAINWKPKPKGIRLPKITCKNIEVEPMNLQTTEFFTVITRDPVLSFQLGTTPDSESERVSTEPSDSQTPSQYSYRAPSSLTKRRRLLYSFYGNF